MADLTPTEACLFAILADGRPHARDELRRCIGDDMSGPALLRQHVHNLRRKLPPGEGLVCVFHRRRLCYQWVGVLPGAGT